jgi:hypothetical protein
VPRARTFVSGGTDEELALRAKVIGVTKRTPNVDVPYTDLPTNAGLPMEETELNQIAGSQKLEAPQFLAPTSSFSLLDDEQVLATAREALGESAAIETAAFGCR